MAEQVVDYDKTDKSKNWLNIGKEKIKKREHETASKRIETLKQLVVKSVNETLIELKLRKYEGALSFFKASDDEMMQKLENEWDILYLNEWNGPNETTTNEQHIDIDTYLTQCLEYADQHKHYVNHVFWDFILTQIWIYCKQIASEIFENPCDVQLRESLDKCLSVCTLLDVLKSKGVLSRKTVAYNIHLQTAINKYIGTKLDIEKWAQTEDEKKVYKHCGVCIQKEAMKSGKAFVKLYKVHKIRKHKEKKRKAEQTKTKQKETATMASMPSPIKEETEQKEEIEKEEQIDSMFPLASVIAVILLILAVLGAIVWNR